ncbi:uncharacterized protein LOC123507183 isoform X1 [Portunus trituberculatus]|nr:uncharacterized protein LOC123507183 isoform X1 [Portunus trituberculatus]
MSKSSTPLPDSTSLEATMEEKASFSGFTLESTEGGLKTQNLQESMNVRKVSHGSFSSCSSSCSSSKSTCQSWMSDSWPDSSISCDRKSDIVLTPDEGFRDEGVTDGELWGSGETRRANSYHSINHDAADGFISDIQDVMSRSRSASLASLEYYRTDNTAFQVTAREELQGTAPGPPPFDTRSVQQSRRLPYWLWLIIAKSLGIKLHPNDKPILATVLYTLTFASALGFFLTNWWFTGFDIASDYTKTTVIDGSVSIFYTLLWGALGLYANKLAYKLFSHKKFLDMLRLHSKTILKLNASVVLFTLMLLIAIFNDINAFQDFMDETCHTVGVEVIVCKARYIFRVVYSIFAVLWNYLVAFVLVSTCRTHVIGIRRFMKTLEKDARIYEARFMGQAQSFTSERPVLEEYTWVDEDYLEELGEQGGGDMDTASSIMMPRQRNRGNVEFSDPRGEPEAAQASVSSMASITPTASTQSFHSEPLQTSKMSSSGSFPPPSEVPQVRPLTVMSNSEILFRFWKIQTRLRMSSMALQRWMMSVLSLVVLWLGMNLIIWLNYEPTLIDMANLFLPLALLPLLASAYAEVNQEGLRVLKFICPLEERLQMIFVLQNSPPLQITVYGFTLSYSTITTAAFGILLAFASKVLIQEVSG